MTPLDRALVALAVVYAIEAVKRAPRVRLVNRRTAWRLRLASALVAVAVGFWLEGWAWPALWVAFGQGVLQQALYDLVVHRSSGPVR